MRSKEKTNSEIRFLYNIPTQGSLCYSYPQGVPQILSDFNKTQENPWTKN